jgi:hypothetical protein
MQAFATSKQAEIPNCVLAGIRVSVQKRGLLTCVGEPTRRNVVPAEGMEYSTSCSALYNGFRCERFSNHHDCKAERSAHEHMLMAFTRLEFVPLWATQA